MSLADLAHGLGVLSRRQAASGKVTMEQRRAWAQALLAPVRDHPRQWGLYDRIRAREKRIVLQANRRSGKTEGCGRSIGAELIERDNYVVRIIATKLEVPTENWLRRKLDGGFEAMLQALSIPHYSRGAGGKFNPIAEIKFPWGSSITVHHMRHMAAIHDNRGFAADLFWADEAQNLELLSQIVTKITGAAGADRDATFLLSGTPGEEVGTMFHRAATGSDPSWARVSYYCWDNPLFGATEAERWNTYLNRVVVPDQKTLGITDADLAALRQLDAWEREAIAREQDADLPEATRELIKRLHPDLLREHFGRWVAEGASYVYQVHDLPKPQLYWAHAIEPRFDDERVAELPVLPTVAERFAALPKVPTWRGERLKEWRAVAGFDLGTSPDPFAWWVGVYSDEDPSCYELMSGKLIGLGDSQMLAEIERVLDDVRGLGIWLAAAVADVSGTRKGTGLDWSWKLQSRFPPGARGLMAPHKEGKRTQIRTVNVDLANGRLRLLAGGATDIEARYLRWRPFDPEAPREPEIDKYRLVTLRDGTEARPADNVLDAMRYAYWWVLHHGHEAKPETENPATEGAQILALHAAALERELGG